MWGEIYIASADAPILVPFDVMGTPIHMRGGSVFLVLASMLAAFLRMASEYR